MCACCSKASLYPNHQQQQQQQKQQQQQPQQQQQQKQQQQEQPEQQQEQQQRLLAAVCDPEMVLGKWRPSLAPPYTGAPRASDEGAPDHLLADSEQQHPAEDAVSVEIGEEQQRVNGDPAAEGAPRLSPPSNNGGGPGGPPSGLRFGGAPPRYQPVIGKGPRSSPASPADDDSPQQQQLQQQQQQQQQEEEEEEAGIGAGGGMSMSQTGSVSPPFGFSSSPDGFQGDNSSGRASPLQPADGRGPFRPPQGAAAAAAARLWGSYAADGGGISPRQQFTVTPPYPAASEVSEAVSSSVVMDVEALNRAVYVRSPLGSFKEPLIHMKLREFSRAHHGVFGTCTLNKVSAWVLTTQFLAVLVGLMACPKEVSLLEHQPFIRVNSVSGGVFIYSFCSLALTYLLALKFAGPRMLT
ncbi:hypothetical protein Emed_004015 [Eimeria media]